VTLVQLLADQTLGDLAAVLMEGLARITAEADRREVREALLQLLGRQDNGWMAATLTSGLNQLTWSGSRRHRKNAARPVMHYFSCSPIPAVSAHTPDSRMQ
jgi:hypothetical protein